MRDRSALSRIQTIVAIFAIAIIVIGLVVGTLLLTPYGPGHLGGPAQPIRVSVTDQTGALGNLFQSGVILGAGSNGTAALIAGIGSYNKSSGFELPVIGGYRESPTGAQITNLTPGLNLQFWEGGVYGAVWNGSAWMLGGQASWGGFDTGSAATLADGHLTNITPTIYRYFAGGGIFAVGWNGSSWLLGGNSSAGLSLLAIHGDQMTNLSGRLIAHGSSGWIQTISWNGSAWMIGGEWVFGAMAADHDYTDLDPESPFLASGVFAAAWGAVDDAWLVGGGAGKVVLVRGISLLAGPTLSSAFDQAVLFIGLAGDNLWLIAGKGQGPGGMVAPELEEWMGGRLTDLSGQLPPSFRNGEIQAGTPLTTGSSASVQFLLVGDGDYNFTVGSGTGALALVTVS